MGVTHKLEPVRISIGLYELIYIPIDHPFRCHCKMLAAHCNTQQRKNVWMMETFPRHYFPAEPLRNQQLDM